MGRYIYRKWHETQGYSPLKKSSKDLEIMVKEYMQEVEQRKKVRNTDVLFVDYARGWRAAYKATKETATNNMYKNIIETYFTVVGSVKLQEIDRIHYQADNKRSYRKATNTAAD